ncbi:hypothetical protein VNI00_011188 [Paramarasmius palmivorus]|uniref:Uncharacterized protein n=1 Tax=Paramarasmius palmivorus TaxID=297713 RepID=A0AAW0CBZ7_9AGAR
MQNTWYAHLYLSRHLQRLIGFRAGHSARLVELREPIFLFPLLEGNNFVNRRTARTLTTTMKAHRVQQSLNETAEQRTLRTAERFRKSVVLNSSINASNTQMVAPPSNSLSYGTPLNTSILLQHQQKGVGGILGQSYRLGYRFRHEKATLPDNSYGQGTVPLPPSKLMPDLKNELLITANQTWLWTKPLPLTVDDLEWRFPENGIVDPGTDTFTIANFYNYYNTPTNSHLLTAYVPKPWKQFAKLKEPFLPLELIILEGQIRR